MPQVSVQRNRELLPSGAVNLVVMVEGESIMFYPVILKEIFHHSLLYVLLIGFAVYTIFIINIQKGRLEQTVSTLIRLLLQEQSDKGLHNLLFHPFLLHTSWTHLNFRIRIEMC